MIAAQQTPVQWRRCAANADAGPVGPNPTEGHGTVAPSEQPGKKERLGTTTPPLARGSHQEW